MSQTLKEKHQQRRILEVKNKLKKIDNRLMESNVNFQVHLLLEALDQNEYKEATEVIDKLTKLGDIAKGANMTLLTAAIDKVVKEINSFTGGGGLSRFKGKISSLFSKTPAKNPILAGLAMVGALEAGFKILPVVLKNNIPDIEKDKDKQDQTLEALTSDAKIKKSITDNLVKAFVPAGTFGKLFGKIPGINNTAELVADIFMATPKQLGEFSKILGSGAKVTEIDPALAKPEEAGATSGEASGKPEAQSPEQQKQQIVAVSAAAKDAGIKEEETVVRFLSNVMGWKDGIKNPYSDTAIQVLKDFAYNKAKVAKGQLDGFVDGLSIDSKKVKLEIQALVNAAEKKKEEEAAKAAEKGGAPPETPKV